MKETVMVGIRTSILRRQNKFAQYIATRPILELCEQATRRTGAQVSLKWWEQTSIDLKGAREKVAAPAAETETESESDSEDEPDGDARGEGEEESQGASGSSGAGRRMNEPRVWTGLDQQRVRTHNSINLRGTESSALIAVVLGWNSTTQY